MTDLTVVLLADVRALASCVPLRDHAVASLARAELSDRFISALLQLDLSDDDWLRLIALTQGMALIAPSASGSQIRRQDAPSVSPSSVATECKDNAPQRPQINPRHGTEPLDSRSSKLNRVGTSQNHGVTKKRSCWQEEHRQCGSMRLSRLSRASSRDRGIGEIHLSQEIAGLLVRRGIQFHPLQEPCATANTARDWNSHASAGVSNA